jgi:hypothetical protein
MKDRRKERRLPYQTPVLLRPKRGKKWYNGSMFNFSRKGMYIESEFNGRPEQQISIVVEKPPYGSGPYLHRARIRWTKELADAVVLYRHGCGVACETTVDYSLDRSALPIQIRSGQDRRSGRDRRKGPACRRRDILAGTGGQAQDKGC